MKQTRTLYNRLVAAFIFTTFIISALFGLLVYNAMKYTEDDILSRRVELEMQYFFNQYRENKQLAKLPNSIGLQSYLSSSPELPSWLKNQPYGIRELHDLEVQIGVTPLPDNEGNLYVVLSELTSSSLESQHQTLFYTLLSIGIIITLIGMIIGVVLGRSMTTPLMRLTTEIEEFDDLMLKPGQSQKFHGFDRKDEVGALSRSFTQLVHRLADFLRREKQFTSYASHELRTPLTIMRNALAILRLPETDPESKIRNLDRIENSVADMEGLIDTFLYLGRERQKLVEEPVSLDRILHNSLDKHSHIHQVRNLKINADIRPDTIIHNDARLIQILFDNIVRNMLSHSATRAHISLTTNGLIVVNDMDTSSQADSVSHESYGLDIIQRISSFCGFSIKATRSSGDYEVAITFPEMMS